MTSKETSKTKLTISSGAPKTNTIEGFEGLFERLDALDKVEEESLPELPEHQTKILVYNVNQGGRYTVELPGAPYYTEEQMQQYALDAIRLAIAAYSASQGKEK